MCRAVWLLYSPLATISINCDCVLSGRRRRAKTLGRQRRLRRLVGLLLLRRQQRQQRLLLLLLLLRQRRRRRRAVVAVASLVKQGTNDVSPTSRCHACGRAVSQSVDDFSCMAAAAPPPPSLRSADQRRLGDTSVEDHPETEDRRRLLSLSSDTSVEQQVTRHLPTCVARSWHRMLFYQSS